MSSSFLFPHLSGLVSLLCLLLVLSRTRLVLSLQVVLDFPQEAAIGDDVTLECAYQLDTRIEVLHTLRWFKDGFEFYKWMPGSPNVLTKLGPVVLDPLKTINGTIYIQNVNQHSSGLYRCEVSLGAPTYKTISKRRGLKVFPLSHFNNN